MAYDPVVHMHIMKGFIENYAKSYVDLWATKAYLAIQCNSLISLVPQCSDVICVHVHVVSENRKKHFIVLGGEEEIFPWPLKIKNFVFKCLC